MPEDDRVFDLKHPGNVAAHASGRPVIVGHHPTMADPMLRPMTHGSQPPASAPLPHPHHPPVPTGAPILPGGEPYVPSPHPNHMPVAPSLENPMPSTPATSSFSQPSTTPAPTFDPATLAPLTTTSSPLASAEPTPAVPAQPLQPSSVPAAQNATPTALPGQDQVQHAAHHELPITEGKGKSFGLKKFLLMVLLPLLLIGSGVYLALDAQLVANKVKLPFELFKESAAPAETTVVPTTTTPTTKTVPPGYSAYSDSAMPFSFNYPTSWGAPTVTTEQGFSKRGGDNKSDGIYAYLVGFATNKDVQMAVTSTKFLPPARGALYYDFLGWCVNPADNKIYATVLPFTSASGVDTPTQATCNQGPLNDATKIDASTIVQTDTKAADGSSLGDVYTKNLGDANIAVVRIKDATRKNGTDIKIILNNDAAASVKSTTP